MKRNQLSVPEQLGLRAGEWVVVRSRDEILATLDERACLDNLPFQPEMLAFCGRQMQVAKVAHKTCDTINKTGGRRMHNAVHLVGGRCDGSAHGGCQADCVFFWKEAWLKRVDDKSAATPAASRGRCGEEDVTRGARQPGEENSLDPAWVCQTTALYDATEPLAWWNVLQYVRDVTTGNHSVWHMTKLLTAATYRNLIGLGYGYRVLVAIYNAFQKLHGGRPYPVDSGLVPDGEQTPVEILDLQPGEWVEIRSPEEIRRTLSRRGFNRGMRFDMESLMYCGGRYRVQMRVDRIINENTGKMMQMKNSCIQLEDVYCRAECTHRRLGCPRAMNTYWREIWLRRVDGPAAQK